MRGALSHTRADLYRDYAEVEELLHELREADTQDPLNYERKRNAIRGIRKRLGGV